MSDFAFGRNTGTGRKTNEQLADEVNRGLWGNGDERKRRLAESGYDYNAVQGLVNAQAANVPASGSTDIPSGTLPQQNAGANVPDTGTSQNVPDMGTNMSGAQQTSPAAGYVPQANAADFWQRQSQRAQEISGERLSNRRRYGVDLPDDVYEVWNEVISNSENPEEEAHRIGAAYQWSRILGEPLDVCYSNLDALNEEYFGSKVTSYKTGFEAVMDMITLGNNNVKIGVLGNQIRDANLAGDTALAESLMNEYRALQQVNEGLQDNIPRSWITEAFKAGAQSLPFTGYVALSGLFGNFIYPGVGTLTAFNTSAYLTAGQEYMDMLENGSDPFTANIWSIVSGGIQGLIEIQLGNVASALGGGARLMGQEAAKRLTGGAIEKISNTFAKKLHYGATGKMIKNFIARYAGDILEEGAEEALQEITSVVGQEIAAAIDGYDIPENDAASIVSRCMEAFKGGVLGAITLGIPTTGLNLVADIKEYKNIGTLAGMMDSRETFRSAVKDSPVFEGMGDQQKNGVIDDIFKAAQSKRDERTAAAVSGIKEVNRAAEGFEDITVDEETGESSAAPATRDEEGNLYTADTTIKETDAGRTGRYKIGDASPDADEKNLYGYINYEIDEDADTVYIRDFVMNFAREGLRQEAYDDFARYMAGYDIQWDTKDSRAASIKETLINNNPNGKNAGLTYYDSVADIADAQTRQRVAEEVAKYMPRVKAQGHLSAAVSLLESMARSQGKNLTTYMFETFGSNIFGEVSDIEQKANEQGATFEGAAAAQRDGLSAVAGATEWKNIENNVRAVIYAGQNADFSTWAHELAHVYRQQIKGDLLSQAEKAFNVKDGDWIHSTVRDADGKLMSSEEAFAYGFQDWLKTGKAPTTQMKNIFQRFAEFLARCYNALKKHIEISPDIERVYSQMLAADDSVLAKAEQAVEAADRKIRAQEKKAQADAQARQEQAAQQRADYRKQTVTGEEPEAEKEPARRTEAELQAEKRDETLKRAEQMARESEANADEEYPLTVAEAEEIVAVQDADEERMHDIVQDVKDAAGNGSFAREQQAILNDNDTTQDQVNDVIIDTAGKSFDVKKYSMDVNDIPEDMFFQAAEIQGAELAETERQVEVVRRQYENTDQWMKAPNGQPTKLTEKQWLLVRTPNFKRWFGNWELEQKEFNIVEVEQAEFNNKTAAMDWAEKNIVGLMSNDETGGKGEINISNKSVDEMLNLNQRGKSSSNEVHYAALTKLREIIHDSEIVDAHPDFGKDENGKRTPLAGINKDVNIDVLYGALRFKGEIYRVKTTIKRFIDENAKAKAYAYDVQKIEVLPGIADNSNNATVSKGNTSITGDILLRDVRKVNQKTGGDGELALDDYSKVLDENGEPLVVYHGTDADFTVFEGKNNFHFGTKKQAELRINDYKEYLAQEVEEFKKKIKNAKSQTDKFNAQNALERTQKRLKDFENPKLMAVFLNARNLKDTEDENAWQEKTDKYKALGYDGFKYYNVYENDGNYSYAVFNSNQIKSATDNNGNFDAKNPNILFQIAGEIGAQNLDNNEEVAEGATRMQNLAVAKQMETEGKNAKAIRLATGWERGADGKWRYEIDDDYHLKNIKATNEKLERYENQLKEAESNLKALVENKNKAERKINDMVKRGVLPDGTTYESELAEAQEKVYIAQMLLEYDTGLEVEKALRRLVERGIDPVDFWNDMGESFYLPQLIDNPELFKAYPALEKTTIAFARKDVDNHQGSYDPNEDSITIYPSGAKNYYDFLSVLEHEVQHAIQRIEGFAVGGRAAQFETRDFSKDIIENLTKQAHELFNKQDENWKKLVRKYNEASIRQDYETTSRISDELENDAAFNEYVDLMSRAVSVQEGTTSVSYVKTPEEQYRSLAGETEARNVEARRRFTPEERRNILLAATEDVSRADQIMLFQTVYHGSPHNFENFSTENIGTGEGAQAFGWGLYFTNQEAIARFYADKLANEPKRISLIAKNEYLKSRKKSLRDVENKEKYEARIVKNINHFKKELKQAQKENDESQIKFYEGLIDDSYKQFDEKERLSLIESFKKDIANAEQEIKELKTTMKNNRNLYTVEIPDEGYLQWDKHVSSENIEGIKAALKDRGVTDFSRLDNLIENQEKWKDNPNSTYTFGSNIYKVISDYLGGDKNASLFLKDLGYIGIDYPANTIAGKSVEGERNYVIFDEANTNIKNHLLYQTAYHGSGADFDKFDTESYGLSGEGSMSFGYGTYVTDDEEIARDYAHRQAGAAKPEYSMAEVILQRVEQEGYTFEQAKQEAINRYSKWDQASAGNQAYMKARYDYARSIKSLDDVKETLSEIGKRNLYTVEIPDNSYISWNEPVTQEMLDRITPVYAEEMYNRWLNDSESQDGFIVYNDMQKKGIRKSFEDELQHELDADPTYDGAQLYKHIQRKLEYYDKENGAKLASKLLNKAGYAGIKYPAGTIYGNGNGAYNYVIFNDDDARIIDHLLFQTEQELYDDAAMFDTWQDFMEAYETSFDPYALERDDYHSQVPDNADASWYKATWELAHGLKPQESIDQEQVWKEYQEDSYLEINKDFNFIQKIEKPGELEKFLIRVQQIMDIDLDSPEWRSLDEEDAAERSRIDEMQRYISTQLKHGTWLTNAIRLSKGKSLTRQKKREMLTLIRAAVRDYRAVYAQVMEDEELVVPEHQTVSAQLRKRLADPDEDFEQMSPERRRQIAEDLSNQEVAARISSGEIKLDSELDGYIKSLKKDIRELSKKAADLQEEVNEDYRRISDAEQRELLRLHEKLLRAKVNYGRSSDTTGRRIRRGLQTTKSYEFERKTLRADYDTIFRQFADLKNVIMITAQVTEAMKHQEQLADMREALRVKQQDNTALQELKKLRVQLVKRTMRRVPFARIDYDSGRLLVAIQRIFEPNLMGGVNEWIGQAAANSRAVASAWLTDIDEREKIEKILKGRGTEASSKMLRMLRDLKSIDDYNKWSNADKNRLSRVMPKEDWIRDLALKQLAKEREESIDLDIKVDEVTRTVRNPKTGEKEDQVRYVIRMPDELAQEVKDALGANLYNDLINKPFSEWTTVELESLAIRVNEIYTDGRDTLAAKRQVKAEEARAIRAEIEAVIRNTGIQINDDDTPEEKKKKLEKIDKILGNNPDMKGSAAAKKETRLNRILHGYADANVRRIARMLDGYEDGINTQELYFKEDECWNSREREKARRAAAVQDVMKKYNLTSLDLNKVVEIKGVEGLTLTVDDLLYIYAADKDYEVVRDNKGNPILDEDGNGTNDDYAPTSRNAVMFGNMLSSDEWTEKKKQWDEMDNQFSEEEITEEERQQRILDGIFDPKPGTKIYKDICRARYTTVLAAATDLINGNEGLRALYDVITKDYADEFPRMNRVSIEEFNQPVNRVRNYVPLIRLESNGETNANQVKQDLLTTSGGNAAGKIGVNKGMTQRRISIAPLHQKPVQMGLYKTWLAAVDRTEHFIAYAPYVRELNRVYKGRDAEYTRRFIESRYGRGMLSYLDDYINEVANPNANKVRTAGDDLVRTLRGKTAPAYLAWKLSGVLKQAATSPAPYFQFVSPLEYISAAWDCTTNHGYDMIKEKSLFMRSRVQDPVYDLVKELEETAKTPFEQKFMKAQELGMKGLEWIDWACVAPGWLACYKKEYARLTNDNAGAYDRKKAELQAEQRSNDGSKPVMTAEQIEKASQDAVLTDAEIDSLAVRYADDCTRQCQPSSRSTDLAPLYKNSSEFAKAYLQFQTSLNVIWQNIRYDLPYAVRTKQFKRAAGMVAGYVMAGVAMNALMDGVTSGGKDDDDDKLTALRNIIFYSTTQFTDSVPLIGSYLTTVTQKAITGKSSYLTTGTDMTPMITKLGSAVTSFSNGNWTKGAGYFAEGVGLALGLPTSGVKEIYKFFTDEKGNFDIGLGNIYGIVGDFIKE